MFLTGVDEVGLQWRSSGSIMKCTINESYNYIHAGKIDHAQRLIAAVEKEVKCKLGYMDRRRSASAGEYEVILGMCHSRSERRTCRRKSSWVEGRLRMMTF